MMTELRPVGLELAGALIAVLLAVLGDAVRGVLDRTSTNSDSLDDERAKSRSTGRVLPMSRESPEQCPPARGHLITCRWSMSPISRDYQFRVTGFAPTTEWKFETIEFDEFRLKECRLQEAKARYTQFFDLKTRQPKWFFRFQG